VNPVEIPRPWRQDAVGKCASCLKSRPLCRGECEACCIEREDEESPGFQAREDEEMTAAATAREAIDAHTMSAHQCRQCGRVTNSSDPHGLPQCEECRTEEETADDAAWSTLRDLTSGELLSAAASAEVWLLAGTDTGDAPRWLWVSPGTATGTVGDLEVGDVAYILGNEDDVDEESGQCLAWACARVRSC
jgi:hypothetical protein